MFLSGQLILARYLLFNFVFWFWSCILSFHLVLSIVLTCYFGFQSDLFVLILHFDLLVWLLENFDFKNIFLNRVGLAVVLLLALLLCFYFFTICFLIKKSRVLIWKRTSYNSYQYVKHLYCFTIFIFKLLYNKKWSLCNWRKKIQLTKTSGEEGSVWLTSPLEVINSSLKDLYVQTVILQY